MSVNTSTTELIIRQLNQAKELGITHPETFAKVYKQILPIINNNQSYAIKHWGIELIYETFIKNVYQIRNTDKVDLAIDSLDTLTILMNIPITIQQQQQQEQDGQAKQGHDVETFGQLIDISLIVYKLVFKYISENDGCNLLWSKLTELKNSLVNKFQSNYPLSSSDNSEHDLMRNIVTKLELLKFLMTVIDYQSRTSVVGEPIGKVGFSLNDVPPDHSLIIYKNMEYESSTLFTTLVLRVFYLDIIIPPLVTATLNHCIIILKKKPQLASHLLKAIEQFDSNNKKQSNYQSVDQFKLARKYVDRNIRIFLGYAKRNSLIPTNFKASLENQLNTLAERGIELRRKHIFSIEDRNIKKRPFEGFYNPSKKIKTLDYKNLYTLNDPSNKLNDFDFSTVPAQTCARVVVNALQKASVSRLTKAFEIIGERYKNALVQPIQVKKENSPSAMSYTNGAAVVTVKKEEGEEIENDEDDLDDEEREDPSFSLAPPKELSFNEKKNHISIIVDNFFKLAKANNTTNGVHKPEVRSEQSDSISKDLTDVAIKSFNKDTWVLLLTRLATRGMRTAAEEDGVVDKVPDDQNKEDMGNIIRDAIFKYFIENIHERVDIVIEWLNEEWFSEQTFQQNRMKSKEGKDTKVLASSASTPVYSKWANKVLDSMINYLEPNDKRIFLRLLSDLPMLNEEMLSKIKSLCFDPARSSIGFLALQFLSMYRPPVKSICIKILKELSESDQDDVREEAKKKLSRL
ncbi:hypothetical protein CANMA_000211 [Candida margitis]|uniref:uncharacterized protein n=1 Tax=Candida margitis TaxID=1775924 RepID=UPI002227647F|nr:uncharacterized protein CANMA_000211 [Candida margitis]KAI5970792.1 hypothetical protein CANMA_000211 [Candida margitis]